MILRRPDSIGDSEWEVNETTGDLGIFPEISPDERKRFSFVLLPSGSGLDQGPRLRPLFLISSIPTLSTMLQPMKYSIDLPVGTL